MKPFPQLSASIFSAAGSLKSALIILVMCLPWDALLFLCWLCRVSSVATERDMGIEALMWLAVVTKMGYTAYILIKELNNSLDMDKYEKERQNHHCTRS